MREKATASVLFKGRKCCYSNSVPQPFLGDYVRLKQNVQWKNDHYIVFADIINKITRSSGKLVPLLLVISTSSMLMVDQRTLDVKYRIPASEIYRVSVSPFVDDIAVFHIHPTDKLLGIDCDSDAWSFASSASKPTSGCLFISDHLKKKGDFILQTKRIVEVVTKLFLVIQNVVGRPPDVNIAGEFNACFNQQIVTINFRYVGLPEIPPGQLKIVRKGSKMEILL